MLIKRVYTEIVSLTVLFIFTYSVYNKVMNFTTMVGSFRQLPLVGIYATITVWVITLSECLIVLCFLFPRCRKIGLGVAVLLLICYTLYILYLIFSSIHLPCTCAGMIDTLTWPEHAYFNAALLAALLIARFISGKANYDPIRNT